VADKDKPNITAPSESVEIPTGANRPTPDAVPFRTSGKEPDAVRVSGDSPLPSRTSGISRAPTPAPPMLGGSAGFGSQSALEAAANMRESIQRAARISDERDYVRDNPVPPVPPKPMDKPSTNDHAVNDHAVLGLCEILALMFGLPPGEALFRGEPLSLRLVGFIVAGAFFAALGPGWPAVRKKFPQQTLVLSIGRIASDARYWLAIILVGFLYAASPEMYRRATAPGALPPTVTSEPPAVEDIAKELNASREQGVIVANQLGAALRERDEARSEAKSLKRQLSDAQHASVAPATPPTPIEMGPITWDIDSQLLVVSGGGPDARVHGALIQGKSATSVSIKEAYAISGLTGHRQDLMANVQYKGYYPVTKVDIPPQAPVQLDLVWEPPLSTRDFLDQWGKFRIIIIYNDTTFEHEFDEAFVRRKLQQMNPGAFGPRVTPKDDK
jgi:hypothetical protein